MSPQTQTSVECLFALIPDATDALKTEFFAILRGETESSDEPLPVVIRNEDAQKLLKISARTYRHYIAKGLLDRVSGASGRGIGVTRESFLRFTKERYVLWEAKFGSGAASPAQHK